MEDSPKRGSTSESPTEDESEGREALTDGLSTIRAALLEPWKRAPIESLIVLTCALLTSAHINGANLSEQLVSSWWLTSMTLLAAVFGATLLHEFGTIDRKPRWSISVSYIAAAFLYGTFLLAPDKSPELYRWGLLTSALALTVFLTPLAARTSIENRRRLVSQFAVRFLQRLVVALSFCFALYLGLAGAFAAIDSLFDAGIPSEIYGHLATWMFSVAAPLTVFAGVSEMTDDEPYTPGAETIRWMCHLGNWVFLPLAGVYLAILYIYEFDVLLTGDAPKNLLSPLALGAAIVVIIMLFLLNFLRYTDRGEPLVERLEWLPVAYLPIVPMPLWAVAVRIQQHGWTEFRYVRILAAVGVALAFGYATYRKLKGRAFSIQALPATFAVLCMLASFGPWGVVAVSKSSQQSTLRAELMEAGALKNGQLHPLTEQQVRELDTSLVQNIHSRADYLEDNYGPSALKPVAGVDNISSHKEALEPLAALGLNQLSRAHGAGNDPVNRRGGHAETNETFADVKFHEVQPIPVDHHVATISSFTDITHDKGSTFVELKPGSDESPSYTASLQPLLDVIQRRIEDGMEPEYSSTYNFRDLPAKHASFPVSNQTGESRGTVVFRKIWIEQPQNHNGELHITSAEGQLLLSSTDDAASD